MGLSSGKLPPGHNRGIRRGHPHRHAVVRSLAGLLVLGAGALPLRAADSDGAPAPRSAGRQARVAAGGRLAADTLALAALDASASGGALSDVLAAAPGLPANNESAWRLSWRLRVSR